MNTKSYGFLNNFTLKMIAIVAMLIDHIGYIFFPEEMVFRAIGRIAFPIFCFLIVEGFHHTRQPFNYLMRLVIFALLSEIPFDLAFSGTLINLQQQNVFFTLALGLLSIFCLEEMNNRRIFLLPLLFTWALAYLLHCDYSVGGVLLISMFYLTEKTPWIRLILTTLILYLCFGSFELYALFAMLPITFYNGKRGPSAKIVFYLFYPGHLLLLYLLSLLL